jgi:molybdopterin-guanine dinucleotide biosynthesis protein A
MITLTRSGTGGWYHPPVNCYLLTGGLSRRMGSPKPDLVLGDRTFVQRVAEAAQPVFDRVYEVTRADAAPCGFLNTICEPPHQGTSPMFGIAAALEHAQAAVWIIAADYPLISTEMLQFLSERFDPFGTALLVPMWEGEPQLLCAGYSLHAYDEIVRRRDQGRFRIRELLDVLSAEIVPEAELRARFEGEQLANVNDPAEYERVRSTHGR